MKSTFFKSIKNFIINILIFGFYLFISSYFLKNNSGGGDIAFMMFMIIFLIIHFLISLIILVVKKNRIQMFSIIFIILVSCIFYNSYLNEMKKYRTVNSELYE